jgi:hypothetical protein
VCGGEEKVGGKEKESGKRAEAAEVVNGEEDKGDVMGTQGVYHSLHR